MTHCKILCDVCGKELKKNNRGSRFTRNIERGENKMIIVADVWISMQEPTSKIPNYVEPDLCKQCAEEQLIKMAEKLKHKG